MGHVMSLDLCRGSHIIVVLDYAGYFLLFSSRLAVGYAYYFTYTTLVWWL